VVALLLPLCVRAGVPPVPKVPAVQPLTLPAHPRVLVFAPHPDDESLAAQIHAQARNCGSTLDQLVANPHRNPTTKLPLRFLPAFMCRQFRSALNSKTIALSEN